ARAVARPYNCLRWGAGMDLEGDDPCQPSVSPNLGAKTVYRTRPYPQTPISRYKGLDRFPSAARPRKIHQRRVEMNKGRLEAFSDGVIAIIITIMVLEMKVPHRENLRALSPVLPVFLTYVLSFTYVGIYWNNHHHMLHTVNTVTGGMLWANLHLLFWLSLF